MQIRDVNGMRVCWYVGRVLCQGTIRRQHGRCYLFPDTSSPALLVFTFTGRKVGLTPEIRIQGP